MLSIFKLGIELAHTVFKFLRKAPSYPFSSNQKKKNFDERKPGVGAFNVYKLNRVELAPAAAPLPHRGYTRVHARLGVDEGVPGDRDYLADYAPPRHRVAALLEAPLSYNSMLDFKASV